MGFCAASAVPKTTLGTLPRVRERASFRAPVLTETDENAVCVTSRQADRAARDANHRRETFELLGSSSSCARGGGRGTARLAASVDGWRHALGALASDRLMPF